MTNYQHLKIYPIIQDENREARLLEQGEKCFTYVGLTNMEYMETSPWYSKVKEKRSREKKAI